MDRWAPHARSRRDRSAGALAWAAAVGALWWSQHHARRSVERATADLRIKAELLEVALENLAEGVTVIDERGVVLFHNRAANEILGVQPSPTTGEWQRHYGVYHEDGETPFAEHEMPMVRALDGESTDEVRMLIRNTAKPQGMPIAVSARPYVTPDGTRGSVGVFRDISERVAAEEARVERERLLSGVVDTAPDAFIVADVDGRLEWWNRAAERLFGWTSEEAVGRSLVDLFVPQHLRAAYEEGLRRLAAGEPSQIAGGDPVMLEAVHRDGRSLLVEISVGELQWEGGRRFHAFLRDVSEREASRRALEFSEERARLAFENAPIGMLLTQLREPGVGRVILANPAVARMLGYSQNELQSMTFTELTHPDGAVQDAEMLRRLLSGEVDTVEYEKCYLRSDGEQVWVALSASVVREPDGTPIHTITQLVDITERRAAAEQLARLNRELLAANEELAAANAELDGFAATVAHDLKNPLTAVSMHADLLLESSPDLPPAGVRAANSIIRATGRTNRLIDDLLAYSRAGGADLQREPLDLETMVEDVTAELTLTGTRPGHVSHDPLPCLPLDTALFRQVVINVIDNGLKYVAPGVEPHVHVTAERDAAAGAWTLRFADNGIGIAPGSREGVFAMFHREADEYPGTGIGLTTCRRIVERHGGTMWIEGGETGGTVVCIWIPLASAGQAGGAG